MICGRDKVGDVRIDRLEPVATPGAVGEVFAEASRDRSAVLEDDVNAPPAGRGRYPALSLLLLTGSGAGQADPGGLAGVGRWASGASSDRPRCGVRDQRAPEAEVGR